MDFGERLKQARKSTGLSQEEFARRIGISRNPIASAEIGKSKLHSTTITRICEMFGINEEWLSEGVGEMKNIYGIPENELQTLLETYSKLPEPSRKKFLDFLSELTVKEKE